MNHKQNASSVKHFHKKRNRQKTALGYLETQIFFLDKQNDELLVNKLNDDHWSIIAPPGPGPEDPGVPTIPISESFRHLLKHAVDDVFVVNETQSLPPLV